MNLGDLAKPLSANQIDFRIQSINKSFYATFLAYKDARVDMQRLDQVCGPLNWKREHTRDNHNCVVSIWDDMKNQWVSKEDTGTESYTEAQKGLASDSFKRACFNWGIGRELYDYPAISILLNKNEYYMQGDKVKASYGLRLKEWKWHSVFNKEGELISLAGKDYNLNTRFVWNPQVREYADLLKSEYDGQNLEGFYTSYENEEDDDLKLAAWNLLDSKTRSGMKEVISDMRNNKL